MADWYNASWLYRVKVTVDKTKLGGANQTAFPVYVDLSGLPAGFHSHCNQTDARDIRVTTSDGETEVPREVVSYTAASDTGELHFKGTLSFSANTDFYIYYGNAAATEPAVDSTYGRNNVWTMYDDVFHLQEASGTTAVNAVGANNGTFQGTLPDVSGAGKIGNAQTLVIASEDYISSSHLLHFTDADFTISFWMYPTANDNKPIINRWSDEWDVRIGYSGWGGGAENKLYFIYFDTSTGEHLCAGPAVNFDAWDHCLVVRRSGELYFYVNGAETDFGAVAPSFRATGSIGITIGRYGDYALYFAGRLDEMRVKAGTGVLASWVTCEYNNQNSPSTFYAVGAEEESGAPPAPSIVGWKTLLGIGQG